MHEPVLVKQLLKIFENQKILTFVDGTLGAGGHAEAFLKNHLEMERLIGIDQDPKARKLAQEKLNPWKEKVTIVSGNFSCLSSILDHLKIASVDGILLDIGVSSMQLDQAELGFSFLREGPLDMRMDPSQPLTSEEIVNTWEEDRLALIFRDFGEEKKFRKAASLIVRKREKEPFKTTCQLANFLYPHLKSELKKKIHPATLVFQALRIAVNRELDVLKEVLPQAIAKLKSGGLLAVISFHSLEDRIVKNFFRFCASDKYDTSGIGGMFLDKKPDVELITRKPCIASEEEVLSNPRSRSAKLRVVKKL